MKKLILVLLTVTLMGMILWSCTSKENPAEPIVTMGINGYVQKGPFVSGSSITIQELTDNFSPNGKTFATTTNNDFGSFSLTSDISTNYIEVIAKGYYFNEVAGELSSSELTLRAILEVTANVNANVNILTTLAKDRIIYLVTNENKTFVDAKLQAENEILNIFGINEENINSFEEMNISEEGTSNAILLAISATLQSNNSIAEFSELISKINLDLKEDGILDNQEYIDDIRNNGKMIILSVIRYNVEKRYKDLGLNIAVPKFEDYIDSDGDGIINKLDDDTYVWIRNSNTINWQERYGHEILSFNNKLWLIGGLNIDGKKINEIWCSTDGDTWSLITNTGPWGQNSPSVFDAIVYDNKIWVLSNGDDLLSTTDGINWTNFHKDTLIGDKLLVINDDLYIFDVNGSAYIFDNGNFVYAYSYRPPASQFWESSICNKNDTIYVSGDNKIWSSTDLENWNEIITLENYSDYHSIIPFNDKLFVLGNLFIDIVNENNTTTTYYNPWKSRKDFDSCIFDNKIWVIGGRNTDGTKVYDDVWFYIKYSDWSL